MSNISSIGNYPSEVPDLPSGLISRVAAVALPTPESTTRITAMAIAIIVIVGSIAAAIATGVVTSHYSLGLHDVIFLTSCAFFITGISAFSVIGPVGLLMKWKIDAQVAVLRVRAAEEDLAKIKESHLIHIHRCTQDIASFSGDKGSENRIDQAMAKLKEWKDRLVLSASPKTHEEFAKVRSECEQLQEAWNLKKEVYRLWEKGGRRTDQEKGSVGGLQARIAQLERNLGSAPLLLATCEAMQHRCHLMAIEDSGNDPEAYFQSLENQALDDDLKELLRAKWELYQDIKQEQDPLRAELLRHLDRTVLGDSLRAIDLSLYRGTGSFEYHFLKSREKEIVKVISDLQGEDFSGFMARLPLPLYQESFTQKQENTIKGWYRNLRALIEAAPESRRPLVVEYIKQGIFDVFQSQELETLLPTHKSLAALSFFLYRRQVSQKTFIDRDFVSVLEQAPSSTSSSLNQLCKDAAGRMNYEVDGQSSPTEAMKQVLREKKTLEGQVLFTEQDLGKSFKDFFISIHPERDATKLEAYVEAMFSSIPQTIGKRLHQELFNTSLTNALRFQELASGLFSEQTGASAKLVVGYDSRERKITLLKENPLKLGLKGVEVGIQKHTIVIDFSKDPPTTTHQVSVNELL